MLEKLLKSQPLVKKKKIPHWMLRTLLINSLSEGRVPVHSHLTSEPNTSTLAPNLQEPQSKATITMVYACRQFSVRITSSAGHWVRMVMWAREKAPNPPHCTAEPVRHRQEEDAERDWREGRGLHTSCSPAFQSGYRRVKYELQLIFSFWGHRALCLVPP